MFTLRLHSLPTPEDPPAAAGQSTRARAREPRGSTCRYDSRPATIYSAVIREEYESSEHQARLKRGMRKALNIIGIDAPSERGARPVVTADVAAIELRGRQLAMSDRDCEKARDVGRSRNMQGAIGNLGRDAAIPANENGESDRGRVG